MTLAVLTLLASALGRPFGESQQPSAPDWELVRTQGMMKLVVVSQAKEARRDVYQAAIGALCAPSQFCYILFWSDRRRVPRQLPMSDAEVAAQVAVYTRNPRTGLDELLLTCRLEKDPTKCFS